MTMLPDSNDLAMMSNLTPGSDAPGLPADNTAELDFQFPEPGELQQPEQPTFTQPDPAPAPQPAPQVDVQQRILDTIDRLSQPQPQYGQPQQQPQQWIDPARRPENIQRANDLLERSMYDDSARTEYNQLINQWAQERTQQTVQEQLAQFQQQMTLQMQAPALQAQAYQQVSAQYGQALSQDAWNATLQDAFGGNPVQIAQALNPQTNPNAPQLVAMLADAAYGRAMRMNPQQPQQRPQPPAMVHSQARNPAPNGGQQLGQWQDTNYVNNIIEQAFVDPTRFNRGGSQ